MVNSKELFLEFRNSLTLEDENNELEAIVYLVFDSILGLSSTDIMIGRQVELTPEVKKQLTTIAIRINSGEPVQYILEEAWFLNRKFAVDSNVLIPRPETEELVKLIATECRYDNFTVLDIGTGSGCISISLKLECPNIRIKATDISTEALIIAMKNAGRLNAEVEFLHHDILTEEIPFDTLDIIVSNPPYVLKRESEFLQERVVKFEPHLALFTPDDDPLKFYNVIAAKGHAALKSGGKIFVEINQQFGKEVANLFSDAGFESVTIQKDIFGNDRIVMGKKSKNV